MSARVIPPILPPFPGEGAEGGQLTSVDSPKRMGLRRSLRHWGTESQKFLTNRWTRLVSYGIAVTLTSCIYAGWQQYSLILMRGGKYAWLCEPGVPMRHEEGGLVVCPAQEKKVGSMFPIAAGLELLGAFFAGFALDHCGPRYTAIAGEIVGFIAILLMMFSTQKLDMMMVSMALTGISIDLVAFPALILEDYFASAAATTAAFVVACQSLSTLIAPILWTLWRRYSWWTFKGIWIVYLLIIWIPCGTVFCLTLPMKREIARKASVDISAQMTPEDAEAAIALAADPTTELSPTASVKGRRRIQKRLAFEAFMRAVYSPEFIVMNILNMVIMVQTAYYQVVVRRASGARISDFVGWAMPVEAVWGVILGRVIDIIKTPAMLLIILGGYATAYLMMLGGQGLMQYFTASLFMIIMSIAYTVKYSFMQETYPPTFYGKLIGITGALGGVSVLLTNILTTTMTVPFWAVVLTLSSFICLPLVGYLWWCSAARARIAKHTAGDKIANNQVASRHDHSATRDVEKIANQSTSLGKGDHGDAAEAASSAESAAFMSTAPTVNIINPIVASETDGLPPAPVLQAQIRPCGSAGAVGLGMTSDYVSPEIHTSASPIPPP